jgi:hypothetical protein
MGTSSSAPDSTKDIDKDETEEDRKIQEFEEQFGAGRSLVRSASFDDDQPLAGGHVGMDSSHGVLKRVYVDVPKGVRSGQYFTVHVNGQDLEVRCPPAYSRISNRVIVELPIDSNPALVAKNLPPIASVKDKSSEKALSESGKESSEKGAAKAPAPKSKRFYVTVPTGVRSGKYFPVHVQGYDLMVRCPPAYSRISDRIVIEVPADLMSEDQVTPGHEPEMYRLSKKERGVSVGSESESRAAEVRAGETLSQTSTDAKPAITAASLITPIKPAPAGSNAKVERVYVSIPKGTRSGQLFTVHVKGHEIKVRCPPAYSRISDRVLVEIPLAPPAGSPIVVEDANIVSVPSSRMSEPDVSLAVSSPFGHMNEDAIVTPTSLTPKGRATRSVQSAPDDISLATVANREGARPAGGASSFVMGSVASGTSGVMSSAKKNKSAGDKAKASLLKDSE